MLACPPATAEPAVPKLWDSRERLVKPDLSGLQRLRFLTTTDFAPFNFIDGAGRLSGFHVDLARALCAELDLVDRCQIQALPWDEVEPALSAGQGEAIIAGIAVSAESRERLAFSRPYLKLPARFVAQRDKPLEEPLHETLKGRRIGVIAGSVHEAILRDYFPEARAVTYSLPGFLLADLKAGETDAIFGDGMRLSLWLADPASENCCRFASGPYLAPEFLGTGMAIAVKPDDRELAAAFDYALAQISANGVFAELYLKYFPVSFF